MSKAQNIGVDSTMKLTLEGWIGHCERRRAMDCALYSVGPALLKHIKPS